MEKQLNKVLILTGLSGAGKDTIADILVEHHGFVRSVPYTTRKMRDGEVEGNPYHFVADADYLQMLDSDMFIESNSYPTMFNGHKKMDFYGTTTDSIEKALPNTLLTVGTQSALRLKEIIGEQGIMVYIHVDDMERERRAKARGSFDRLEWDNRMYQDIKRRTAGLMHWEQMDAIVDNTYNPLTLTIDNVLKAVK